MNRRRDDIVARLAQVDMIIGMNRCLVSLFAGDDFVGPGGDDFVHVHICRGSRSGLKHIHHELVIKLSIHHLLGCFNNCLGDVRIQKAELCVHPGGTLLY